MKQLFLVSFALLSLTACGGDDETAGIDRAKVDAAPQRFKDSCQAVCTTAEEVRRKGCGQVQYSSHEACYLHCVDNYLRLPQCEEIFTDANECLSEYVCQAEANCLPEVVIAAACRDGQLNPGP